MDNKDKVFETDIAAVAKKAGVSPKGSSGIAIPESVSGLVFEFDTPDSPEIKEKDSAAGSDVGIENISPESKPEAQASESDKPMVKSSSEPEGVNAVANAYPGAQSAPKSADKTENSQKNGIKVAPVSIFDTYRGGDAGLDGSEPQANIRTTYVPRFTEVSENYRMKDDPRPKRPTHEPEEHTVAQKIDPSAIEVAPKEASAPELDPTAELNESADGIIVSMDNPTHDENSETLSVYKFKEDSNEECDEPAPEKEEVELRELLRSLGRAMPSEPSDEAAEREDEEEISAPESEYSVPDPDKEEIHVCDFDAPKRAPYTRVDPDGISNELPEMPSRRTKEFVHLTQRDSFKDKFLDTLMSQRIRLVALCLFFVTVFAYELLADLGKLSYEVFEGSRHSGALAAFDLLIISCMFVFALPEIISSVKWLIRGKATPELSVCAAYIVSLIYLLVVSSGTYTNYPLFGSAFAVLVLSTVLSSHLRTKADFVAFKLVAMSKEKQILDRKMTRELPEENLALDGLVDEYKSRTARLFRAGFVTDFFEKTNAKTERSKQTAAILSVSFASALISAVIAYFVLGGLDFALGALNLVFILGIPAFSVISHKLAYRDAQRVAHSEETAVIGERSYLDFSEVDVIAFEDNEIFGPDDVALKRFMLYGDSDNMEKAMRQMCALFGVVGGPLHYIFSNSLDTRMRTTPAQDPIIEEDGLSGEVGGKRISAGTEEYMRRHGVAIPEGAIRAEGGINTTKIMYAAEDGEVFAKFYIRYSFSEEFTMLLPTLKKEGIVPLIYTGDPNVSNELLRILSAGADCMRVVKRLAPIPEDEKIYSRVSAGIVTYGDKINSIDILLLTKKYKRFLKLVSKLELYGLGLGVVLGAAFTFAWSGIPACFVALWQLLLCGALGIGSARCFSRESGKEKKDD